MNYVIIDDEISASSLLRRMLERYEGLAPEDQIYVFNDSVAAFEFISHVRVDLIFLDIEMPRMTGEEFARRVAAELDPKPFIVFTTAFPQYSLFAWDTGAVGYILKPFSPRSIYEAIERYRKLSSSAAAPAPVDQSQPFMKCFPCFELMIQNEPVFFKNKKSKELLALLVHNQGNWVPLDKITFCLFEDLDETSSKNYLRTVLYRLKKTLAPYGLEDIIESRYGGMRIRTGGFRCDYYEYLEGNHQLFNGDYMEEYPWAETTRAYMFHFGK